LTADSSIVIYVYNINILYTI